MRQLKRAVSPKGYSQLGQWTTWPKNEQLAPFTSGPTLLNLSQSIKLVPIIDFKPEWIAWWFIIKRVDQYIIGNNDRLTSIGWLIGLLCEVPALLHGTSEETKRYDITR